MSKFNPLDFLLDQATDALIEARTTLVQEAWFGRRAAPPSQFDLGDLGWELDRVDGGHRDYVKDLHEQAFDFDEFWSADLDPDRSLSLDPERDIER